MTGIGNGERDNAVTAYEALDPERRALVDQGAPVIAKARGVSLEEAREIVARAVKTTSSGGGTGTGH